jgi:hypothetical protein
MRNSSGCIDKHDEMFRLYQPSSWESHRCTGEVGWNISSGERSMCCRSLCEPHPCTNGFGWEMAIVLTNFSATMPIHPTQD